VEECVIGVFIQTCGNGSITIFNDSAGTLLVDSEVIAYTSNVKTLRLSGVEHDRGQILGW